VCVLCCSAYVLSKPKQMLLNNIYLQLDILHEQAPLCAHACMFACAWDEHFAWTRLYLCLHQCKRTRLCCVQCVLCMRVRLCCAKLYACVRVRVCACGHMQVFTQVTQGNLERAPCSYVCATEFPRPKGWRL